jgi:acyl-coenzyme A synthetase/AMP-(fatty) acid ligase
MSAVIEDAAPTTRAMPLATGAGTRTIAFHAGLPVPLERFLAQVRGLAALLPEGRHAINLCDDRYRFLLAFCAVALRGQVTLLPASRAPSAIAEEAARHADSYCLGDAPFAASMQPPHYWCLPQSLPESGGPLPCVDPEALAAIGFTSGSTGEPGAHAKHWNSFLAGTRQNFAALRDLWPGGSPIHVVATVPPQHMYGMELTVLLPLFADATVHAGRPFFPHDILQALREMPAPRLLVTTPVHLRALLDACVADASIASPPLAGIVSATAPMPAALAAAAEARFGCELRELFGSTETCVIARRRTAREQSWTLLPGVQLHPQPDGCLVHAPHLRAPVALADLVELQDGGRFLLRGRNADLLEIAGKRASLGDLTCKLQAVPGVVDCVVFQHDALPGAPGIRRIAAFAVAPGLDEGAILETLRRSIDPVFLPRPLRCVDALPRNATGKLSQAALLALLDPTSN